MAKLKNLVEYISDPKTQAKAQEAVGRWNALIGKYPEFSQIQDISQASAFYDLLKQHPDVSTDLFNDFEVKDTYKYLPFYENSQYHSLYNEGHIKNPLTTTSDLTKGTLAAMLGWAGRAQIIEEDPRYQKIGDELKKQWLKTNNRKDFFSPEGIDFLYGSLTNPQADSLHRQIETEFEKRHPKNWKKYQEWKGKIEKNPALDRGIQQTQKNIETHLNARMAYLKHTEHPFDPKELRRRIENHEWEKYGFRFDKKATAYRNFIDKKTGKKTSIADAIDKALTQIQTRQQLNIQQEASVKMETTLTKLGRFARHEPNNQPAVIPVPPPPRFVRQQLIPISFPLNIPLPQIPQQPTTQQSPPQPPPPRRGRNLMNGANNAIQNGKQLAQMAKNLQKLAQIAKIGALFLNPVTWIILGCVLLLIIVFMIILRPNQPGTTSKTSSDTSSSPSLGGGTSTLVPAAAGLTLSIKATPENLPVGPDIITYTITAIYVGDKKIMLYDPLPPTAQFLDSSAEPLYDQKSDDPQTFSTKLTWFLDKQTGEESTSPEGKPQKKYIFTFKVKPKITDIELENTVYGQLATGETTGEEPPSGNDCNGLYSHYMQINTPTHLNFGDPTCELRLPNNGKKDTNAITSYLTSGKFSISKEEALQWYITMFYESSGFNANAVNLDSKSLKGAYGLMQMNPVGQGNGIFDRGDVVWRKQIENAFNYNEKVLKPYRSSDFPNGKNMCYWQPANCEGFSVPECHYPAADWPRLCQNITNNKPNAPVTLP